VTPGSVAFGPSQVNVAKTSTVTLRNTGSGPLSVTGVAVTGTDFTRQGGTCANGTLTPDATCTVIVRFLPSAAAARTGSLTFTGNSGGVGGTQQIAGLSGTGVNAAVTVTPGTLAFGNNSVGPITGGNGVTRTLSVRNSGPAGSVLAITSTSFAPGASPNFTVTGTTCPTAATLASNATCTITARFRATNPLGAKTATLRLNSNAPGSPTSVPMTGNATPAGFLGL
jgi:hypothetical protein